MLRMEHAKAHGALQRFCLEPTLGSKCFYDLSLTALLNYLHLARAISNRWIQMSFEVRSRDLLSSHFPHREDLYMPINDQAARVRRSRHLMINKTHLNSRLLLR